MNRHLFGSLTLCLLIITSIDATALAETQYISDQLVVVLRDVPKDTFTSLANLSTDTPVEVLREEKRFYFVRTAKGLQGYIPKQYLTPDTPKPMVIDRVMAETTRLKTQIEKLKERLTQEKGGLADQLQSEMDRGEKLSRELEETQLALNLTRGDLDALQKKYQLLAENSEHVVDIVQERDHLTGQVNDLQLQIEALEKENTTLLRSGVIKWFLAGGGVFLVGWLLGKVSRKKRRGF